MLKFRRLDADEIECRVKTLNADGCSILLYKNARVDQNILDETVGAMNWQRSHTRDNANCIVSIWDEDKKQWVSKEDTGTESQTEEEKGLASDSFKRACFNWGIGRELYTSPFIWVNCKTEKDPKSGKYKCNERFSVHDIGYDSKGNINLLCIANGYGDVIWDMDESAKKETPKPTTKKVQTPNNKVTEKDIDRILAEMDRTGITEKTLLYTYKIKSFSELTQAQFESMMNIFSKTKDKGAK